MTDCPEIGGYLELHLPAFEHGLTRGLLFQSGRAALRHLLSTKNVKKTFVPNYVCDAVVQAVVDTGSVCSFYSIDSNFQPLNVDPGEESILIYVNYFGLNGRNVEHVIERYAADSVIIDNAQALFAAPADCLGTVYSPRKFIACLSGCYPHPLNVGWVHSPE